MGRIILVLVLLIPIIEIAGFIWIGGVIGILPTLGAILLTAFVGLLIIRWQGMGLVLDSRVMMARGEIPARNFAHGMMLAIAGFFLVVPGFVTDAIGFLLLIPPLRDALYGVLSRNMVVVSTYQPARPGPGTKAIDLDPDSYRQDK
jgi:UPF0716 protein FxsA